MSADIINLRTAVVEQLRAFLPDNVLVETHGGRFNGAELRRYATRAPAVLVAAMSIPELVDGSGPVRPVVQLAAFIVTRDVPQVTRDEQGLTLTEALLRHIPGNRWGLVNAQLPARINGENLYSGEIDKLGVAMWAVSWRQEVSLSPVKDIGNLAPFETYRATHLVGTDDDPDTYSAADLPQPDPEQED